jgi:hypothetical protein
MATAKTAICKYAGLAALAGLMLLSLHGPGHAEAPPQTPQDYALIFGTVWDAKNQPAFGIAIKIRRANEKKARWQLTSDHRGEFAQRVPTGSQDYVIWADIKMGKGKAKPETKVHVDKDERVDVSLHLTE